jgi:hypothetical protein
MLHRWSWGRDDWLFFSLLTMRRSHGRIIRGIRVIRVVTTSGTWSCICTPKLRRRSGCALIYWLDYMSHTRCRRQRLRFASRLRFGFRLHLDRSFRCFESIWLNQVILLYRWTNPCQRSNFLCICWQLSSRGTGCCIVSFGHNHIGWWILSAHPCVEVLNKSIIFQCGQWSKLRILGSGSTKSKKTCQGYNGEEEVGWLIEKKILTRWLLSILD